MDEQHKSLAAHYVATQEFQNKFSAGVRLIFHEFYPNAATCSATLLTFLFFFFKPMLRPKRVMQRRRQAYVIAHRHPLRSSRMLMRMRATVIYHINMIPIPDMKLDFKKRLEQNQHTAALALKGAWRGTSRRVG